MKTNKYSPQKIKEKKMKHFLTMIAVAAAVTLSGVLEARAENALPLKVGKNGLQRWNTSCKSVVQDGKAVKLELGEKGENDYYASAVYYIHHPKAGEITFAVEVSTKDRSFHKVQFYLPLQPKAADSKIQRRYIRVPMKDFKMDGEVKRYSVKTVIPEEALIYAGFGLEFRSRKPSSVTIHSATLEQILPEK